MKKIKRLEYQYIKFYDLNAAFVAKELIKENLKNERNIDTLNIIQRKEFYEDVNNYYIEILTNEYQLKEIYNILKKNIYNSHFE